MWLLSRLFCGTLDKSVAVAFLNLVFKPIIIDFGTFLCYLLRGHLESLLDVLGQCHMLYTFLKSVLFKQSGNVALTYSLMISV